MVEMEEPEATVQNPSAASPAHPPRVRLGRCAKATVRLARLSRLRALPHSSIRPPRNLVKPQAVHISFVPFIFSQ